MLLLTVFFFSLIIPHPITLSQDHQSLNYYHINKHHSTINIIKFIRFYLFFVFLLLILPVFLLKIAFNNSFQLIELPLSS